MSDLYVPDVADCGHQNCTRANIDYLLEYAHRASRSDVLEWLGGLTRREKLELLGWQPCETVHAMTTPRGRVELHCPDCLSGLVPPASQVEALAEILWRQFLAIWDQDWSVHSKWDENTEVHQKWRTRARAALIAAMREGVGDEDS